MYSGLYIGSSLWLTFDMPNVEMTGLYEKLAEFNLQQRNISHKDAQLVHHALLWIGKEFTGQNLDADNSVLFGLNAMKV